MYGVFAFYNINLYIYIYITKYFIKVVLCEKTTFLRTPFKFGVLIFYLYICTVIVTTNIMKVIEDIWDSFPRVETCTDCKSKVKLESKWDCAYQPYVYGSKFFELKEALIWECPCCKNENYIYL